jgi:hypothetical protein
VVEPRTSGLRLLSMTGKRKVRGLVDLVDAFKLIGFFSQRPKRRDHDSDSDLSGKFFIYRSHGLYLSLLSLTST